jgi:mycofactocin precursor
MLTYKPIPLQIQREEIPMVIRPSLPNDEVITTVEPLPEQGYPPVMEESGEQPASLDTVLPSESEDVPLEDEIEEELIIEVFTIDGICGVY